MGPRKYVGLEESRLVCHQSAVDPVRAAAAGDTRDTKESFLHVSAVSKHIENRAESWGIRARQTWALREESTKAKSRGSNNSVVASAAATHLPEVHAGNHLQV